MNEEVMKCSKNTLPVLLLGETGTGKSYSARQIHNYSKNSNHKFIHINITSLSESLFESELFGHVKGAFTGAVTEKIGFCQEVGKGTLLLDEIGELSLALQAKLLTVMDEGIYYQVGSTNPKKMNGRIIVATNRNLGELVQKGEFRADLYYRLRLNQVRIRPIRKMERVDELICHEINNAKLKFEKYRIKICPELVSYLERYEWPGNRRELKNTIEVLVSSAETEIKISDLPEWITETKIEVYKKAGYHDAMSTFERQYLKESLKRYKGGVNLTAQRIGLNKVTLISKLKKYDIDRKEYKQLESVKESYGF